jgi:hypothetical protein
VYESKFYSGYISGASYLQTGVIGNCYLTGKVTGYTVSGYLNINKLITGSTGVFTVDNSPYYPVPTGDYKATASIQINTGNLSNFNFISINNTTITYNLDTVNYTKPNYFSSVTDLSNIINSISGQLNCTGSLDTGTNTLYLKSIISGASGNNIQLITNSTETFILSSNSLTGGYFIYPKFYLDTQRGGVFSGYLNEKYGATGYYSALASGTLTGTLPVYVGTRTFFDVWDLRTGQNDIYTFFKDSNLVSGASYTGNLISPNLGVDQNGIINIQVAYNNYLSVQGASGVDVVEISVISNNLPSGASGISFRLTGVK